MLSNSQIIQYQSVENLELESHGKKANIFSKIMKKSFSDIFQQIYKEHFS